jgi:putative membrane protein
MWLVWVLAMVVIGLVVFVVVWAVNGGARRDGSRDGSSGRMAQPQQPPARSTSRQILDERYARGELTADEYREHLTVLGEG